MDSTGTVDRIVLRRVFDPPPGLVELLEKILNLFLGFPPISAQVSTPPKSQVRIF
jgi:hypothetical protein